MILAAILSALSLSSLLVSLLLCRILITKTQIKRKNAYCVVRITQILEQTNSLNLRNLSCNRLSIIILNMCQCVLFGCWWCNICGEMCAGVHEALFLCSCWLCKPDEIAKADPACCHCLDCDGWGGHFFCYGCVCCAPRYVKNYSDYLKGKN